MYGKNLVRKPLRDEAGDLRVNSIFYTLQGEGPYSGRPAIFIRLAGCNLRCWFCDTEFEQGYDTPKTFIAVVKSVLKLRNDVRDPPIVVLTGGEPNLQDYAHLVLMLTRYGFHTQVETAGTLPPPKFFPDERESLDFVVSPKTPKINAYYQSTANITGVVAFKYIISTSIPIDYDDGLPMARTQRWKDGSVPSGPPLAKPPPSLPRHRIYLQPCDEGSPAANEANLKLAAELCLQYGYTLGVQTHKLARLP